MVRRPLRTRTKRRAKANAWLGVLFTFTKRSVGKNIPMLNSFYRQLILRESHDMQYNPWTRYRTFTLLANSVTPSA